jgi:hypothetical protein
MAVWTLAPAMGWKRKLTGGFLGFVGYMLSPLSWWNDLFVNVPLAWAFASVVSLFYRPAFTGSLVVGYWLTNVVGLVLLHKGAQQLVSEKKAGDRRRELLWDLLISLLYTAVIVGLVKFGVLKPIEAYLK